MNDVDNYHAPLMKASSESVPDLSPVIFFKVESWTLILLILKF